MFKKKHLYFFKYFFVFQYVHYEIDYPRLPTVDLMKKEAGLGKIAEGTEGEVQMFPPQVTNNLLF